LYTAYCAKCYAKAQNRIEDIEQFPEDIQEKMKTLKNIYFEIM